MWGMCGTLLLLGSSAAAVRFLVFLCLVHNLPHLYMHAVIFSPFIVSLYLLLGETFVQVQAQQQSVPGPSLFQVYTLPIHIHPELPNGVFSKQSQFSSLRNLKKKKNPLILTRNSFSGNTCIKIHMFPLCLSKAKNKQLTKIDRFVFLGFFHHTSRGLFYFLLLPFIDL